MRESASTSSSSSSMAPKKAAAGKGAAVSAPGKGVETRSQGRCQEMAAAAPPPSGRRAASLPSPPRLRGGLRGTGTGNRSRDATLGSEERANTPPASPARRTTRAGSPPAHSSRRDDDRATPSSSRRSAPGLPGVYSRNDALAMVRSLMEFPLLPNSPQYTAWHDRINALLDYSRRHTDAPRDRSQSGLSPRQRTTATAAVVADAATRPAPTPARRVAVHPAGAPYDSMGSSSSSLELRDGDPRRAPR